MNPKLAELERMLAVIIKLRDETSNPLSVHVQEVFNKAMNETTSDRANQSFTEVSKLVQDIPELREEQLSAIIDAVSEKLDRFGQSLDKLSTQVNSGTLSQVTRGTRGAVVMESAGSLNEQGEVVSTSTPAVAPKSASAPVVTPVSVPAPATTPVSSAGSSTGPAKPSAATASTRTPANTPPSAELTPAQRAEVEKIITAALGPLGLKFVTEANDPSLAGSTHIGEYADKTVGINFNNAVKAYNDYKFTPYDKNRQVTYGDDGSSKSARDYSKYDDLVQYILGIVSHEVAHAAQYRAADYVGELPRAGVELSTIQLENSVFKKLFPDRKPPARQPVGSFQASASAKPEAFASTILRSTPEFVDSMQLDEDAIRQVLSEARADIGRRQPTESESAIIQHLRRQLKEFEEGKNPHEGKSLTLGKFTPYSGQQTPPPVAPKSTTPPYAPATPASTPPPVVAVAPKPAPVSSSSGPAVRVSAKNNPEFIAAINDPTRDTAEIAKQFGYSPGYVGRARATSGKKYNPTSSTPTTKPKLDTIEELEIPLHLGFDATAVAAYEANLEEKDKLEKSIAELSKKRAAASGKQMEQLKKQEEEQIKRLEEVKAKLQAQTSLPPTGLFSEIKPDDISAQTHAAMQTVVKQAADVLGHSSVRDPRAKAMADAAKGTDKDQTLRAVEAIFSQVFMRDESGDVSFLAAANGGDSYTLDEVQDLFQSILPAVQDARTSGIYPVSIGSGGSIRSLGNIVPDFSQEIMSGRSSDSDSPDTPQSMRVRGGTNYLTKNTSDTYLGRQSIRTSMGRRSSDYREVAQGADTGLGTQVVGFEAKHVFPNKVAMEIEEQVREQERIVRQQLEEGDVVDMQVGDKTYKVPRYIAENRLAMMRSVDRASEHTGLTRMGNERGPRGALEGNQSVGLMGGLHLGKMFESIVSTGDISEDLTQKFLESTSHQQQDDLTTKPGVKPEQQVNNARLFAERHKEKLAYEQRRLEQSFATNTGQSATQNLGQEIIDLAMQQKLIDELLITPTDAAMEEAQAQRRGEILYPKQHAANLANPESPQHNIPKLSSDEALALLYGHSIAGVAPYGAAFMNIREQALPVQQLVQSTGGSTEVARRYDQYSPVARIIEAARNQDPEEVARLQSSLVPEDYQDELNRSGTNTAKKIDGREVDVAHTAGMVEKDLSYTINDMFGLSSQKHHNIFNALHYAGKVSDEEGNLLPPDQIRQSLGGRTGHGLASIHKGSQDLQDISRTGIPIVEYAKLATQDVPTGQEESHQAMLNSIHQVSPAMAELSRDQLHALSNVDYSQGGQQAITQVIKIVGSSIQKKLKEAIQHQAKKAGLNEADTSDLFAQNEAGRVPQGFESLFREFNFFNPATIESNPEFSRAITLLMGFHEQAQGGESVADFTARALGTTAQLSGLRTGVANVTANPAAASTGQRYDLASSARSFVTDETGKAPPAMARNAALAAAEIPRLSEELAKAKKATAELKKRHESASGALKLNLKLKLREAIAREKEAERALLNARITSDPSQVDQYFSKQNAIVNSPTATEQERVAAQMELAASQQIAELTAQNPDIIGGTRNYLGPEHGYAGKTQTERLAGLQEHLDLRQQAQGGNRRRVADLARFERKRQRRIDDIQGSDNIEFADNVNGFVGVSAGTSAVVTAGQRDLVQGTSLATFISNEAMLDRNQDEAYSSPMSFDPLEKAATSLTEEDLKAITAATPEELLKQASEGQVAMDAGRRTQRDAHAEWLASLSPTERNRYILSQSHQRTGRPLARDAYIAANPPVTESYAEDVAQTPEYQRVVGIPKVNQFSEEEDIKKAEELLPNANTRKVRRKVSRMSRAQRANRVIGYRKYLAKQVLNTPEHKRVDEFNEQNFGTIATPEELADARDIVQKYRGVDPATIPDEERFELEKAKALRKQHAVNLLFDRYDRKASVAEAPMTREERIARILKEQTARKDAYKNSPEFAKVDALNEQFYYRSDPSTLLMVPSIPDESTLINIEKVMGVDEFDPNTERKMSIKKRKKRAIDYINAANDALGALRDAQDFPTIDEESVDDEQIALAEKYMGVTATKPAASTTPPSVPEPDNTNVRLAKLFAATKQLHEERRKTNVNYIVPADEEIMQQVQQMAMNQLDETSTGVPRQSAANEQKMQETIATITQEDRRKRRTNQRPVTAAQLATARQHYTQYAGKEGLTQEETQKLSAAQIIMQRHAMQQITKNFGDDTSKGIPQLFDMLTSMSPRPGDTSPEAMQRRGVATTVASLVDSLGPDQLKAAQNLDFSRADSRIWMANTFPQFVPIMAHLDSVPNVRRFAGRRFNGLTAARSSRRRAEAADAAIAAASTSAKPTYFDLETSVPKNAAGEDDKSLSRTIFQASVLSGDQKKPTMMYAVATKEIAEQIKAMAAEANAADDPARRDEIINQMRALATTDVYGKTGKDVGVNADVIQSLVAHALAGGTVYDQETIKDRVKLAISGSGAVVGHNLKGFDLPVLYGGGMDQAAKDAVPESVMKRVADTLELSRDIAPGEHKLIDSYKRYVDPAGFTGAHDAGQDVLATRALHKVLGRRRVAVGKLDMSTIPAELQPYVTDSRKIAADDPRISDISKLHGLYSSLATMQDFAENPDGPKGSYTMSNMEKMFSVSTMTPEEQAKLREEIKTVHLPKYAHMAIDGSFYTGRKFLEQRFDKNAVKPSWSYAGMAQSIVGDERASADVSNFSIRRNRAKAAYRATANEWYNTPEYKAWQNAVEAGRAFATGTEMTPIDFKKASEDDLARVEKAMGVDEFHPGTKRKMSLKKRRERATAEQQRNTAALDAAKAARAISPEWKKFESAPYVSEFSDEESVAEAESHYGLSSEIMPVSAAFVAKPTETRGSGTGSRSSSSDTAGAFTDATSVGPTSTRSTTHRTTSYGAGGAGGGGGSGGSFTMSGGGDVPGGGGGGPIIIHVGQAEIYVQNGRVAGMSEGGGGGRPGGLYTGGGMDVGVESTDKDLTTEGAFSVGVAGAEMSTRKTGARDPFTDPAATSAGSTATVGEATISSLDGVTSLSTPSLVITNATIQQIQTSTMSITSTGGPISIDGSASLSTGRGGGGVAGKRGVYDPTREAIVNSIEAARNAYDQSGGLFSGRNIFQSKGDLTDRTISAARNLVGLRQGLVTASGAALMAGLPNPEAAGQYAELEASFTGLQDAATIEQASAAMLQLLSSIESLTQTLSSETGPGIDEFKDNLQGLGKLASTGTMQLNKTAKTQQQTESLQIGKMEERVQAAVTQPGIFNFGRRREDKKAALRDFAEGFLGDKADTLYDERTGELSLPQLTETVDATGKRVLAIDPRGRRKALQRASDKDLQRQVEYLNQLDPSNPVTFESLSKTQRAYARAQQSQNQVPFADKMFYAASKLRDLQFFAQGIAGIPQIPQQIMQTIEMATNPALSAERTMTTARSLSLTPQVYNAALSAAAGQQARFGGSLSTNVGKITDFIPLTNAYGVDMTKSLNVARKLAAFDPAQGMQGASIALKEFLSGNVSSLSRRFEINRSALSKINTGDATEMLDSLDNVLSSMGVTDKLIDDQANTMATKYDKMVGRLETIGQNLSGMLVSAVTPALESMLGSDSDVATTTGSKTLNKLTNESLQSYGDAALSNKVTGLDSLDPYADPAKFNKDLDNVLRMANNEIAVQARGYSSGTGLVPQLAPYRMMENASATQRFSMQHSVMKYLDQGMGKEQAYLQALRENQGDFNTSQEFLFQRNPINGLNMSAPDQYLGGLVKTKPGNLTPAGILPQGPDLSTLEAQARIFGTYDTLGTMSAATPGGLNQQQIDIIGGIADKGLMLESMGANKAIPEKVGTLAATLPGSSMIPGVSQMAAFATNSALKNMSTPDLAKLARKMGTAAYATVQRRLDNDTVELLDEYGKTFTARISNIDAPEHTASAGDTSVPKNDVLGRAMGLTQADYVITQADRNEYLKQAQAAGMTDAQAKKMIDAHGYDKTLIKLASQPKVLAVGDSKDRYERQLASLFTTDKNGNLVAVNRKMAELGGAPVAFSGLPEEARTAMDVLAKNAADTKLGAINTQAAGLDLGGNAIISQQARDAYFQRHYLGMGGTVGMATGVAGAGVLGLHLGGGAIMSAFPGSAAATAISSAGAIGAGGVFGLAGGIGLAAGLGYGAYAYNADMNDTSVAKQRELYEIQANMNKQENQRRRSMNYVYNAGLLPNTERARAAATTGGGEKFRSQTIWEKILAGLGSVPGREGVGGQRYENLMPTGTEQDAQTQVALDMADEVSKEMEKTKDEFAKRRETAPDSVKKVYDRIVINPMDPGTAEKPNYISVLDLQQTLTAIDTVAASSSNEQFQDYANTPEYLRARAAIANQTADPEKQKINELLEKNKITIPRRILKGGPDYIRNRLTSAADAESFTFNTEDMLKYSATEQDNIYRYGLDQLGSLRNYSQPAKEYQDQTMGKMVGLRSQRFNQFMDANAMNALFMGRDNSTSPTSIRGTAGVKAAALNMLDQSYFIKNNAGDQGQIKEVRAAQTAAVDAMLEQARAFREQADVTRPFATVFRSTFANLVTGMNIAGDNFRNIYDTMAQGNPLFAIDFAKQSTGLDWKQSIASQLYVPGFNAQGVVDPTQSGFPLRPGLMAGTFQTPYATGPRASIQYASDLYNDKKSSGMLNPAEMLNIFQSAAQGQTELVRRQIQFNNQMRDLNLNHNRALEDIARNGMRQLEDIHINYTRQMIQLVQQNEITKRMDRASVNKSIESADITPEERRRAHVVQESGQMFARHAGQSNPQGFLERIRGTAMENDPQVIALREAMATYNSISYDDSAGKQSAWDKVIDARNPLEGRIKQMMEGANPTDTANYESYLALLGRDPAREAQAQTYANQRTSQFVETAAERKGLVRQKTDLLYQQSGEGLTRRQLQKSLEEANASGDPLQIAAARKAMDDFELSSARTAEAIALVSQKLSAISNTAEMFQDAWTEAFANITNNASATVLGLVQSLDDFNRKMQQQLEDQDLQFGRQIFDLKQAFIDAAREIATQIPGEMAKGYTAVMTYLAEQSRAEALMLSGNYSEGEAQTFANMNRLGDALYGSADSDAKRAFMASLEANIPKRDVTATGVELPSNGIAAALAKVNGKWALRVLTIGNSTDQEDKPLVVPEDDGRPRGSFSR
jgi:endonuclease YncB( thermonuclease family)